MSLTAYEPLDLHDQVEHNLTNHPPVSELQIAIMEELRRVLKTAAHTIVDLCPDSRERHLALTSVEQATFCAVAAVARAVVTFEPEDEAPMEADVQCAVAEAAPGGDRWHRIELLRTCNGDLDAARAALAWVDGGS